MKMGYIGRFLTLISSSICWIAVGTGLEYLYHLVSNPSRDTIIWSTSILIFIGIMFSFILFSFEGDDEP